MLYSRCAKYWIISSVLVLLFGLIVFLFRSFLNVWFVLAVMLLTPGVLLILYWVTKILFESEPWAKNSRLYPFQTTIILNSDIVSRDPFVLWCLQVVSFRLS